MTPDEAIRTLRGLLDAIEPLGGPGGFHGNGVLGVGLTSGYAYVEVTPDLYDWLGEDDKGLVGNVDRKRGLRWGRIHGGEAVTVRVVEVTP